MYDLVTSVLSQLFIHLCATVVLTWCAVALMSNESSSSVFIFSWVSSTTSFQPSTRSRYLSSDWLRTLIDIRWFWMSRVSRLLVSFSVAWVLEAWSRTWRRTMVVNFLWALNYWSPFIIWAFFWRPPYLLLCQYHSLNVFKLFLQLTDLLTVQSCIQAAWTVRCGPHIWDGKLKKDVRWHRKRGRML